MSSTAIASTAAAPASRRGRTVGLWVLQVALAAMFAGAGLAKLGGDAAMVDMFADIGAGQWLRYAVGSVEVAAAVGLLVPRLAGAAAAGLVALMTGATVTNVAVLDATPLVSSGLLVAAGVVAWARRSELRGAFALLRR